MILIVTEFEDSNDRYLTAPATYYRRLRGTGSEVPVGGGGGGDLRGVGAKQGTVG